MLFDSCPGDLSRLLTGYNAFLASRPPLWQQIVLQGGILAGLVLALWRLAHSGVSRALTSLLPGMLGGAVPAVGLLACLLFAVQLLAKLSNALYWDNLVRLSSRTAPQLFLYSHRDPLVPSSAVEAVAARTVAAGRSVTTKVWSNSKHVDHLKHNPQEYSDTVLAFVAKAVQAHHRS